MTWAKLDDRFHSHPKALRAWEREPASLGLYLLALSWVAANETDGHVPSEWINRQVPVQLDRDRLTETLKEAGLMEPNGEGWLIHDYLDYNLSRADIAKKRKADAERQRRSREARGD